MVRLLPLTPLLAAQRSAHRLRRPHRHHILPLHRLRRRQGSPQLHRRRHLRPDDVYERTGSISVGFLADRFSAKNLLALTYFTRGLAYVILLTVPGEIGMWTFAVVAGTSWIATNPPTTTLTADIYGVRALGTIGGISFLFHQIGGAASILMAGVLYDLTGSYQLPFALAGSLLFPAAIAAFTIKEKKYSIRYQPPVPARRSPRLTRQRCYAGLLTALQSRQGESDAADPDLPGTQ